MTEGIGVKNDGINDSRIIDAGETGTITEGMALQIESSGTVKIWAGGNYYGVARILRGTATGVSSAVAGDRVGCVHWGCQMLVDSEDDVLVRGQPVKATGTAGKFRLWVGGVDFADTLAGYVEKLKDADKKIVVRLVGGR